MADKKDKTSEEKMTLEEAFAALEETITAMESPEMTLDSSMALYEKGVGLLKYCSASIDTAEKQIIILKGGENPDA